MLSVVVLAADIVRIVFLPSESDPVLLVHPNAVLALSVSSQSFEAITRDRGQVIEPLGAIEHRQLPMHNRPDVAGHTPRGLAVSLFPKVRGRHVRERLDHWFHDIRIPCIRQLTRHCRLEHADCLRPGFHPRPREKKRSNVTIGS